MVHSEEGTRLQSQSRSWGTMGAATLGRCRYRTMSHCSPRDTRTREELRILDLSTSLQKDSTAPRPTPQFPGKLAQPKKRHKLSPFSGGRFSLFWEENTVSLEFWLRESVRTKQGYCWQMPRAQHRKWSLMDRLKIARRRQGWCGVPERKEKGTE